MTLASDDIEAIEHQNNQFASALNNADVSAIVDLFGEGALVLPPRRPALKDDGIKKYFLFLAQQCQNAKFMTSDLDAVDADTARETGAFSFRSRGENAARVSARYFLLWRRSGDEWKINTFIWSRTAEPGRSGNLRAASGV